MPRQNFFGVDTKSKYLRKFTKRNTVFNDKESAGRSSYIQKSKRTRKLKTPSENSEQLDPKTVEENE